MAEINESINLSQSLQYGTDTSTTGQINAAIQANGTFNLNFNIYDKALYTANKAAVQADIEAFLANLYTKVDANTAAQESTPAS